MLRGFARIRNLQGGSRPVLAALMAAMVGALTLGATAARADSYPDKPIRLVVQIGRAHV